MNNSIGAMVQALSGRPLAIPSWNQPRRTNNPAGRPKHTAEVQPILLQAFDRMPMGTRFDLPELMAAARRHCAISTVRITLRTLLADECICELPWRKGPNKKEFLKVAERSEGGV